MSRRDTDPNRGNRKIPLATVSAADLLGLNDETAPAEDPRGGERPCCGHPNALTDPLHAIPAAGRGDTVSSGEAICQALSQCVNALGRHDRRCSAAGRGEA